MFDWNESRVTALKALWMDGTSGTKIAELLGHKLTRNAVIGKANRLGLERERKPQSVTPRIRKPRAERTTPFVVKAPLMPVHTPEPESTVTLEHKIRFMRAENHHCRWPLWSGDEPLEERFYCGTPGADVLDGRPYCGAHSRMAFDGFGRGARPYAPKRAAG